MQIDRGQVEALSLTDLRILVRVVNVLERCELFSANPINFDTRLDDDLGLTGNRRLAFFEECAREFGFTSFGEKAINDAEVIGYVVGFIAGYFDAARKKNPGQPWKRRKK